MKFTKEQVLENIKAKFRSADGKTSQKISDRTILDTVEPLLAFATDETEINDFVEKVFVGVNSANINFIKDTTDFVKNYKLEPPIPPANPAPPAQPAPTQEPTDIAAIVAQAVASAVQPLQEKISTFESTRTAETVVKSVKDKLFGGIAAQKYKDEMQDAYDTELEIFEIGGRKYTAEELETRVTNRFNKLASRKGYDPAKPITAESSKTEEEGVTDWSAEVARKKEQGKIPDEKK